MKMFHLAEIVEMGIEKEKKRRDFYDSVARHFSEKQVRDLFTRLRDWEEEHVRKFTEIKGRLSEPEPVEYYPGELKGYMQALVDDMLYKAVSPESFSQNVKTPLDAISYGIGFEKDAILFFSELLRHMVSGPKEVVRALIDEEKQHIIYLSELKRKFE